MSTPLRNLSRQTAKYLEKNFFFYSNDDHLIDKGFIWKEIIKWMWIESDVYIWRKQIDDGRIIKIETKEKEYLVHCFHTVSLMEQ
jgi:hypothetical protein